MIDHRNLTAPRTMKDAFERHIQRDVRSEYNRQRIIDICAMAACTLGAFVCAGAIGVMIGWLG